MFNYKFIRYVLGNLTLVINILLLITLIVSLYHNDGYAYVYLRQIIGLMIVSFLLKYKIKLDEIIKLRIPDLFITTSIIWAYCIFVCMSPYLVIMGYSLPDAIFEMASGVSTTGASIIPSLKELPISLIFWRSITQWLGGIGFIVIGVLILPNLNSGGMKLFKTESSDSEGKTFAHLHDMAFTILGFYFFITIACSLGYWLSGMESLDAIQYALTTVATGGFAPNDEPFDKILNEYAIGAFFLFIASLPFQVFTLNILRRTPISIFKDNQIKIFTFNILIGATFITFERANSTSSFDYSQLLIYFKDAIINLLNIASNCGYTISEYWNWGPISIFIMLTFGFIGGCAGSTAGGFKIFRINLLFLYLKNQFNRTIHPNSKEQIIYNNRPILDDEIKGVIFFLILFIATFVSSTFILVLTGLDINQAANIVYTCITNTGLPITPNINPQEAFVYCTDFQKIFCAILMVTGRLEFTTLVVLLYPRFWKFS